MKKKNILQKIWKNRLGKIAVTGAVIFLGVPTLFFGSAVVVGTFEGLTSKTIAGQPLEKQSASTDDENLQEKSKLQELAKEKEAQEQELAKQQEEESKKQEEAKRQEEMALTKQREEDAQKEALIKQQEEESKRQALAKQQEEAKQQAEKRKVEEERKRAEEERKKLESEKKRQEELKKQQNNSNKKPSNPSPNSTSKTYYIAAGNRYYHKSSNCKFLKGASTTATSDISNKFACNCVN